MTASTLSPPASLETAPLEKAPLDNATHQSAPAAAGRAPRRPALDLSTPGLTIEALVALDIEAFSQRLTSYPREA